MYVRNTCITAPIQLVSLPISLISLSHAATRTYFLWRTPDQADPNPPVARCVLPMLALFLPVTFTHLTVWAFLLAYGKAAVLLMVFGTVCMTTFILVVFEADRSVVTDTNLRCSHCHCEQEGKNYV